MKTRIYRSELLDILRQGYPDIPNDVELYVSDDGKVTVYCPGFKQPEWLDGVYYMRPDATIEIYDLGDKTEWDYIDANREQIIRAIRKFDEGSKGNIFDWIETDKLYDYLSEVAKEKGFTAMDLIVAAEEGW